MDLVRLATTKAALLTLRRMCEGRVHAQRLIDRWLDELEILHSADHDSCKEDGASDHT